MLHMMIEQTQNYQNRVKYDPNSKTFFETDLMSLFFARNFPYPYGWLVESGTPPDAHLDVILVSEEDYELGDLLEIKVIGVFIRKDQDHKLIAVRTCDGVDTIRNLSPVALEALMRLYPQVDEGEGWFDEIKAMAVIDNFLKVNKVI